MAARSKWLWIAAMVAGALLLGSAAYFYSACVLFESACRLGNAVSCDDLHRTLRLTAILGAAGAAAIASGVALLLVGRRMARERQGKL